MAHEHQIMGLFSDESRAIDVIRNLRDSSWNLKRVHSPFPSHRITEILQPQKSKVGWFTLAGGILGFLSGFALSIFTASKWSLIISGKPVIALIPFVIVGFEFTILFSVFGNICGFLILSRLPSLKGLKIHDPRCSGSHVGVVVACEAGQRQQLIEFFEKHGAEVKTFD